MSDKSPVFFHSGCGSGRAPWIAVRSAALLVVLMGAAALADETDRAMAFVDKSAQATDLYNQRHTAEALAIFDDLVQHYADLDQDAYASMGQADCLLALGRVDEARAAYEAIIAAHPDHARDARQRLREMALTGEPDDALLKQLREDAATAADNDKTLVYTQLGRALQKRAVALMKEAIVAFRTAAEPELEGVQPSRELIVNQADSLAEIQEDLSTLIDGMERIWHAMHLIGELSEARNAGRISDVAGYHAKWTAVGASTQRVRMEASWSDAPAGMTATIDGRSIQLTATQALQIRRHQERINAILNEAARAGQTAEAKK